MDKEPLRESRSILKVDVNLKRAFSHTLKSLDLIYA